MIPAILMSLRFEEYDEDMWAYIFEHLDDEFTESELGTIVSKYYSYIRYNQDDSWDNNKIFLLHVL